MGSTALVEGGRKVNDAEMYWKKLKISIAISFGGVGIAGLPYLFPEWECFSYFRNPLAGVFVVVGLSIFFIGQILMFHYSKKYFSEVSKKEVEKVDEFVREWEMERWREDG